jgi:hypothetical protein
MEIANTIAQTSQATNEVTANIAGISDAAKAVVEDSVQAIALNHQMQKHAENVFNIVNRFKYKSRYIKDHIVPG